MAAVTVDGELARIGTGPFQRRLLGIFGLVWAADAMQVLAIGFTAPLIARDFDIPIPQALQTGTLFFVGMLVGAWSFGRLADRFGRRQILIATVLIDAVFGLLSAFAPSFAVLLLFRFLTGVAVGGTLPVDYAMMAEFLPARSRGRWLVGLESFWALGTVLVALVSWVATSSITGEGAWRWIFAATALPALIGLGLRFWVPESPYHLLRSGRAADAAGVLDRMARVNGAAPVAGHPQLPAAQPAGGSIWSRELMRPSLLILLVWLLVSAAYYGVFVWLPVQLAGGGFGFVRGYGFLVLVALAQLPGYALAAWGVERWGRRPTLIAFLLLSAAGCFLYVVAGTPWTIAAATLLMSFALLGTWGALYAFTPEIYPTALRATGMGTAGAMARLGGLLAPSAVAFVVAVSFEAAIALFAVLLLVAAVAVAAITVETKGQALA